MTERDLRDEIARLCESLPFDLLAVILAQVRVYAKSGERGDAPGTPGPRIPLDPHDVK